MNEIPKKKVPVREHSRKVPKGKTTVREHSRMIEQKTPKSLKGKLPKNPKSSKSTTKKSEKPSVTYKKTQVRYSDLLLDQEKTNDRIKDLRNKIEWQESIYEEDIIGFNQINKDLKRFAKEKAELEKKNIDTTEVKAKLKKLEANHSKLIKSMELTAVTTADFDLYGVKFKGIGNKQYVLSVEEMRKTGLYHILSFSEVRNPEMLKRLSANKEYWEKYT